MIDFGASAKPTKDRSRLTHERYSSDARLVRALQTICGGVKLKRLENGSKERATKRLFS
jgi:hypothetical protein